MSRCLDFECPDCVNAQCVAGGCENRVVEREHYSSRVVVKIYAKRNAKKIAPKRKTT